MRRRTVAGALAGALAAVALVGCGGSGDAEPVTAAQRVARGAAVYTRNCAPCHGGDLRGTASGPSLLDARYAPARLPDRALRDAVRNGADRRADFPAMAALPALGGRDIDAVRAYVRDRQAAAGMGDGG